MNKSDTAKLAALMALYDHESTQALTDRRRELGDELRSRLPKGGDDFGDYEPKSLTEMNERDLMFSEVLKLITVLGLRHQGWSE
jgi:hypothetical protein